MTKDFILTLYSLPQTVFTFKELSLLFPEIPYDNLKSKTAYFSKAGKLKKIRNGIYAKENYNLLELANKIYTPSYISLQTVLLQEGLIFQYDSTIFVVSYLSRLLTIDGNKICYRQMKEEIILNKEGIFEIEGYFIASKERAFLDAVFLYKNFYFDNLDRLDWEKVFSLQDLYQSKALLKRVKNYYKIYKENLR